MQLLRRTNEIRFGMCPSGPTGFVSILNFFIRFFLNNLITGEHFRVYFTKSDDKTYLVAYHCWESGNVEWFTYSNIKVLPQFVKSDILRHVETLGFNSNDYKETNYQR